MPRELKLDDPGFDAAFAALLAEERAPEADVAGRVRDILAEVRRRGDAALVDYTRRFDRLELTPQTLRIPQAELAAAAAACPAETLEALKLAARRIEAYHARQRPEDALWTDDQGVRLGHRWTAVAAAGVYVPGGTAAYPSSVLMNLIPAKVAGVPRVVMVVPTPEGKTAPLVLAAARLAGADEVYRVGGAQAVAALAYGTETIAPVDKIVGPRQRLRGRGQAPGLRAGRHRLHRRPLGDPGGRRRRQRSRLDRRRPLEPGRARPGRPVDPDHRRRRLRRVGAARGRGPPAAPGAHGDRPAVLGTLRRPSSWSTTWPARHRAWSTRSRPSTWSWRWPTPRRWWRGSATPAASSSAATPPRCWATTWPGPTTCCRRRAAPASPRACRPWTS